MKCQKIAKMLTAIPPKWHLHLRFWSNIKRLFIYHHRWHRKAANPCLFRWNKQFIFCLKNAWNKPSVSAVILANLLSVLQLVIPSILSTSPHECVTVKPDTAANRRTLLIYGVPCPDWIKWAGIQENVFSFLLHQRGRRDMNYWPNTIKQWMLLEYRAISQLFQKK